MNETSNRNLQNIFDIIVRLGILFGLLIWCLLILAPFLSPVIWGILIAVILYPFYSFLRGKLGGKSKITAVIIAILLLAIIIFPATLFVGSLVDGVQTYGNQMSSGEFEIPSPPESVIDWPVIGDRVYDAWKLTSQNLGKAFDKFDTQIAAFGRFMLSSLIDTGLGLLQFILSIIIAAILLATSDGGKTFLAKLFDKVVGERGQEFAQISAVTIKNVGKGILGVAGIQSTLAGIGFIGAGVPFAGLWTLICLILAIIQLGPALVIIPVIIYLFTTASPVAATLWTIYLVAVMVSDNILKPIMLGKGAPVPMLVIFLGSIGGFILNGFVGLFVGAIVLSLGYKLFIAWINGPEEIKIESDGGAA